MIYCDDHFCKITVEPADYPGCYFVIVDNDPEHVLGQACISESEAWAAAVDIRAEIVEDNSQFGVGA